MWHWRMQEPGEKTGSLEAVRAVAQGLQRLRGKSASEIVASRVYCLKYVLIGLFSSSGDGDSVVLLVVVLGERRVERVLAVDDKLRVPACTSTKTA